MRYRSGADGPTLTIELTEPEERRYAELCAGPMVSLHDHPVRLPEPLIAEAWTEHWAGGVDVLADDEIASSSLDVVLASALSGGTYEEQLAWADGMAESVASTRHPFRLLRSAADLDGPGTAIGLALEDLGAIGTDLAKLDTLHEAGICSAGISYNTGTPLGGGLAEETDPGLSRLGEQAVTAMNELGLAVDISHAGDRTALDVARVAQAPVLITHAGARHVWPSDRMKPDDVLRAVADTGGVIGVESAPGASRSRLTSPSHDIHDVVAHILYCADLVGVEHVALGPDTFYGDHVGLYGAAGWASRPTPGAEPLDIDHVAGADNPTETPRNVARCLIKLGWPDDDIRAVLGGNALRALRRILRAE